MGVIWNYRET